MKFLSSKIEIIPLRKLINSQLFIPGSKSITNRAFLIAGLAKGKSVIKNALVSDDTRYMINALKELGVKIIKKNRNYIIQGKNGKFQLNKETIRESSLRRTIFLGNAGTAVRFLTATAALQNFSIKITGNERMRERPIQDLIDGLNQLGAKVYSQKNNGCPPVIIEEPLIGGICSINGQASSQFFSAILLSAPYAKKDVTIKVIGELVSKPYVNQTIKIMKDFGIEVKSKNYQEFLVKAGQGYQGREYEVEADASSATYFAGIAMLNGGEITIKNLNPESSQADVNFLEVIKKMGGVIKNSKFQMTNAKQNPKAKVQNNKRDTYSILHTPYSKMSENELTAVITIKGPKILKPLGKINLQNMPDGAMTVAVLCAFAKGKSVLTGLSNLRLKETDRLKAMTNELKKIGCDCRETADGLIINGDPEKLHGAAIETYDDHRMAMCFAVAGTKIEGIKIKNPSCVKKTYPRFWKDLEKMGIKLQVYSMT